MATIYSNQYQDAYVDVPSDKIRPGDQSGDVRFMFFDHTITAAPTDGDILKLGRLPKGARIVDACLSFPDLGTAGVLNVGWAASAELDGPNGLSGSAIEAADADGLFVSLDVNAAADTVLASSQVNVPGILKKFSAAVDIQATITTAWTVTSGTIRGYVSYVIV